MIPIDVSRIAAYGADTSVWRHWCAACCDDTYSVYSWLLVGSQFPKYLNTSDQTIHSFCVEDDLAILCLSILINSELSSPQFLNLIGSPNVTITGGNALNFNDWVWIMSACVSYFPDFVLVPPAGQYISVAVVVMEKILAAFPDVRTFLEGNDD